MANIALYAGSFDPFTDGHLDVVKQAASIFDGLVIAIAQNSSKGSRCYPAARFKNAVEGILERKCLSNCSVIISEKLIVHECQLHDAKYIVRGIRSTSDFLNEENMARINHQLDSGIKTIYLRAENDALSSSMVRELLRYGQDVSKYIPPEIAAII